MEIIVVENWHIRIEALILLRLEVSSRRDINEKLLQQINFGALPIVLVLIVRGLEEFLLFNIGNVYFCLFRRWAMNPFLWISSRWLLSLGSITFLIKYLSDHILTQKDLVIDMYSRDIGHSKKYIIFILFIILFYFDHLNDRISHNYLNEELCNGHISIKCFFFLFL